MSPVVAIGIGCRKNCPVDAIEALVLQALSGSGDAMPSGLFTIEAKRDEAGLAEAARRLGLDLTFLGRDVLRAREADTLTRSAQAEAVFGVASVAEAAALAGAGPGSVLVVPRIAAGGATCAIARPAP
jgi:cobalt-precorrin 5A hydrolase